MRYYGNQKKLITVARVFKKHKQSTSLKVIPFISERDEVVI